MRRGTITTMFNAKIIILALCMLVTGKLSLGQFLLLALLLQQRLMLTAKKRLHS